MWTLNWTESKQSIEDSIYKLLFLSHQHQSIWKSKVSINKEGNRVNPRCHRHACSFPLIIEAQCFLPCERILHIPCIFCTCLFAVAIYTDGSSWPSVAVSHTSLFNLTSVHFQTIIFYWLTHYILLI